MQNVKLQVPANAFPGMAMNVALSDGRKVSLTVPPGASAGSYVTFSVPSANAAAQSSTQGTSNNGFSSPASTGQWSNEMDRSFAGGARDDAAYVRDQERRRREAAAFNATGDAQANRPAFASGLYRIFSCCTTDFMQSLSPLQLWCAVGCCGCSGNGVLGSVIGLLPCCSSVLYMVGEDEVGVVERLGKFQKIVTAGPVVLSSPCLVDVETLTTRLPLRLMQRVVKVDTKTKDNVFCAVEVSVQYRMGGSDLMQAAECAAYKVENFVEMLSDQVSDVVRSKLSKIDLDKAFLQQAELQSAIEAKLTDSLAEYGYVVHKCLVTNFVPAASVKQAMNNTFVQALQKQVDAEEAETRKIVRRCESEAEAISKALLGKGVSLMRRAYVNGMQECMDAFVESMAGDDYVLTRSDVLYMQLLLQHFDSLSALTEAAASSNAPRPKLYLACDPKSVSEMRKALDVGHVRTAADGPKRTPRKSIAHKEVEYA